MTKLDADTAKFLANRVNKSAACGAWQLLDGSNAHEFCTGKVALPEPYDNCQCDCHTDTD